MINEKIERVLVDVRNGKPIILVDEYDRENEGDLVVALEKATVENIAFTMLEARGLMCLPMSVELMKLAGLQEAAMICEIINKDGSMSSGDDLVKFAEEHDMQIISIEEIYEAAYNETL